MKSEVIDMKGCKVDEASDTNEMNKCDEVVLARVPRS